MSGARKKEKRRNKGQQQKITGSETRMESPFISRQWHFGKREVWISLIASLVITAIAYIPSLDNDFTNWDDPQYVTENYLIRQLNPETLRLLFSIPEGYVAGNYHPLTMLTLALDYQSGQLDAKVYHRTNYLFHLANTALVFIFIFLLTGKWYYGATVAVMFGIHPMHVESVAWIAERKDVLYTFFYFTASSTYVIYSTRAHKKPLWYSLTLLLFLLSLLSKGQAVTLPVLLLLIDWFLHRRDSLIKIILEKIPFFALSLVFGIIAIYAQQTAEAITDSAAYSLFDRVFIASHSLIIYLIKWLVPYDLANFYQYPPKPLSWVYYISPLAVAGIGAAFYFLYRKTKHRGWLFGPVFFIIHIALVIQLLPVGSAVIAERYTYVSYTGLLLLFPLAYDNFLSRLKWLRQLAAPVFIAYTLILAYITYQRCEVWENSLTLWNDCIEKRPTFYVAYNNRGNYYSQLADQLRLNGKMEEAKKYYDIAMKDYLKALEIEPSYPNTHVNRGNILGIMGDHAGAIESFTRALSFKPNNFDALLNRGMSYAILKQYDKALEDYARAEAVNPNHPRIYELRGYAYFETQQYDKAIEQFSRYLRFNTNNFDVWFFRGTAYLQKGNPQAAISDLTRAIGILPTHAGAYYNRSIAYNATGDYKKALSDAMRAKQLGQQVSEQYLEELRKKAQGG